MFEEEEIKEDEDVDLEQDGTEGIDDDESI